ncbi:Capsular polysaccharide biosynthesis protein [Weissella viridescens]|uniref:Capsular polysaccharide biosynthesis protein n=1 Tax=Weissella viridescens TaxID=1629 RepID=A0A380P730_WEIVI|nr:Capsular polysaccharide biosynthesis protein [Weissella viridescens]
MAGSSPKFGLDLAMGVIFAVVGFTVSKFVIHPEYSSSTAVLVNRKQNDNNAGAQFQNQQADVQLISTYKILLRDQLFESSGR